MRRKGIFTLLTAAFMVLAFSAVTFAANNVRLTTTVPNIPRSLCYQAGTDTMEFDTGSAIAEMDVMQFTLNNNITVCKAIDFFVTVNAGGAAVALETSADAPIATTNGSVNAAGGTGQWGFLVQAAAGSQIITVTFRVRDTVTGAMLPSAARVMTFTGAVAADKFLVKLFDGKFGFGTSLIYTPVAGPLYTTALTAITGPTTNILCINTMNDPLLQEYVQNTPDSIPVLAINKLFFSGDYRIAHIMAEQLYSVVPCAKATVGHIKIGAQGQPDTCQSFDFEVAGAGLTGPPPYCADHLAGNRAIITTSSTFAPVPYSVTMQIVVERAGVALAVPGVYWSSTAPGSEGDTSLANACAVAAVPWVGTTYRQNDAVTAAAPRAVSGANCDLLVAQKAVYLDQPLGLLTIAGDSYLYINLPDFNYDPAEILAGDVVKVKMTFTKTGCGSIGPLYVTVGTFGCGAAPVTGSAILCPYVTSLHQGDNFWSGIAIVNTSATAAGTVALTAYKQDGTTATFTTPSIPAGEMYVSQVGSGVPPYIVWAGTTPANVPAFIRATSTTIPAGSLEGFVMMSDSTTESMGYLCK